MIISAPQLLRCDVCGADIGPNGKPGLQQVFADDFPRPTRVSTCMDFRCLDLARQYARPCFPEQLPVHREVTVRPLHFRAGRPYN